jgi:hypothetical protein
MPSTPSSSVAKSKNAWTSSALASLKIVVLVVTRKPRAFAALIALTAISKTPSRRRLCRGRA